MPGKTEEEGSTDDSHPFGLPWLDSSYQETLLPSAPWHKVCLSVSDALAKRIEKQFTHPERKQMIFELMGEDFIQHYFPQENYDPLVIEPPLMSSEDRRKLQLDAQNWLQNSLTKVCSEVGCLRPITAQENGETLSRDTEEFLRHTRFVFTKALNRHLLLRENAIQERWEEVHREPQKRDSKDANQKTREQQSLQQEHQRLHGDPSQHGLRSILKNADRQAPMSRLSTGVSTASVAQSRGSTANVKGALFGTSADPPVFWGMQSNTLGRSIIAILKRDPRRFPEVAAKLRGRQLPGLLRTYIWMDVLLKREREKLNDIHIEKLVRERFGRAVARGTSVLKLKRATHSPISGLVENAVVETFDKTPGMRMSIDDPYCMKESAKALNILYVYDRSYEPYLIHWLFPIQLAFIDQAGEGEHVYELAMNLDLLNKGLFPKWPEVFASAEKVINRLKASDAALHDHLKSISQRNPNINPKEFLVQLIHQEKSEAEKLLRLEEADSLQQSKSLLADPLIFLRKWMGEGFVSVLDTQAALFVWDQCFLQRWELSVLEDTCMALLLLLRHRFMQANNYTDMKQVFLRGPCLLYTLDIQHAFVHIQNQKDLAEVPKLNRLRPRPPERFDPAWRIGAVLMTVQTGWLYDLTYIQHFLYLCTFIIDCTTSFESPERAQTAVVSPDRQRSPTPSVASVLPLDATGIKNLRLTLIIPAESLQKEPWLASLKTKQLRMDCSMFFGSIRISQQQTSHPGEVKSKEKDKYGSLTYRIEYPKDRLVFDPLDIGKYDLEMEMGGYPFALIELKYRPEGVKDSVTLGWTRLKLYQHKSEVPDKQFPENQQWLLMEGDYYYTIYAGPTLEKFAIDPLKTPKPASAGADSVSVYSVMSDPQGPSQRVDTPFLERFGDLLGNDCQLGAFIYNPQTGSQPTPTPVPPPAVAAPKSVTPTSKPSPVPRSFSPKKTPTPVPKKPGIKDTLDIYVDAVSNIPDNATIVKVTGRLIKTGEVKDMKDILALPDLLSPARNPRFRYQLTINKERLFVDAKLVILLRVYTVDVDTRELVVIGSCLFEVFDDNKTAKVGAHCRQLMSGMPDLKKGLSSIYHTALDTHPRIPACRLYIRIAPTSQTYTEPPALDSYQSSDPPLTESEKKVRRTFNTDTKFPHTVKDAIQNLKIIEGSTDTEGNTVPWLRDRLDNKKHLSPNQPAENIDLYRLVHYRLHIGFNINIVSAYGLPDGYYIQCFARMSPGSQAMDMSVTSEGFGRDEKLITLKHNWESQQKAPVWEDDFKEWHPHLDQHSCIIVQIFGIQASYKPNKDHKSAGKLSAKDGTALTLGDEDLLGWTIVPLFEKEYVLTGRHHVPIFKGKPSEEMLEALTQALPEEVIEKQQWSTSTKYDGAALVVDIWDGHFLKDQVPGGLVRTDFLLDLLDKPAYEREEQETKGRRMYELLYPHLDKKDQKGAPQSELFKKEQAFFSQAMSQLYYSLMENALLTAGYGPL